MKRSRRKRQGRLDWAKHIFMEPTCYPMLSQTTFNEQKLVALLIFRNFPWAPMVWNGNIVACARLCKTRCRPKNLRARCHMFQKARGLAHAVQRVQIVLAMYIVGHVSEGLPICPKPLLQSTKMICFARKSCTSYDFRRFVFVKPSRTLHKRWTHFATLVGCGDDLLDAFSKCICTGANLCISMLGA